MQRLIEAAPTVMTEGVDNLLTPGKGRRARARDLRDFARRADRIGVPSKWYAVDGSGAFYYFRLKRVHFVPGDNALGKLPTTIHGVNAVAALAAHDGRLTDQRPSGWMSAATMAGIAYGGLEGGPRDWGWSYNEDLDLDIGLIEQVRAGQPGPQIRGHLSEFAGGFGRALAGAR